MSLARGLDLVSSYTYTDIKVTKSDDVDLGKRPIIILKHMASSWVNYMVPVDFLQSLGLGVGVVILDHDITIWRTLI
jgi:iron complex outermembrane receptor protein